MASRRRTSPKAEPLDLDRELDEMYSSAITRPNLGFLRITESPGPASSMDGTSIDGVAFPTGSDDIGANDRTSTDVVSPDITSTDTVAIDLVSMDNRSCEARPAGKWKLHRCLTVQDGHSANEQLLYEMLWRSAREVNPDERVLAISREDMASQTRITVRNVKGVLDRLIGKLAIERIIESNSFSRTAATYQIYSYRVILERRRQAGLEWVTRANGVKFIPSGMAHDLLSRPKFLESDSRQPQPGEPGHLSIDTPTRAAATTDMSTVAMGSFDPTSMDPRSIVPPQLGPELRRINPAFDTAAVASLWRECRMRVPDCTVEEVIHFSQLTAARMRADNVNNTIGAMLSSASEFFDGRIVNQFRAKRRG